MKMPMLKKLGYFQEERIKAISRYLVLTFPQLGMDKNTSKIMRINF